MANYPDVRAELNKLEMGGDNSDFQKAMHIAFEDQLVQKIMPKLRGIDTRGKFKTECLDKIQSKLNEGIGGTPFNLNEDFALACELGYGQFIWQSANYLIDEDNHDNTSAKKKDSIVSSISKNIENMDTPPDEFRPTDSKRNIWWNKKTKEEKSKWISDFKSKPKQ